MYKKYISYRLDQIKQTLSKSTAKILIGLCFVIAGIILGIILSFDDDSFVKVLYNQNETIVYYVSGTADISQIFFGRLLISIFAFALIFMFCLNYYTSFLSLFYILYQTMVFTMSIYCLCDYQGLAGILLSIFFAVPINLLLIFVIVIEYAICSNRAKNQHVFKTKFANSFDENFGINIMILAGCLLILHIAANLIIPLILRGIFIIDY